MGDCKQDLPVYSLLLSESYVFLSQEWTLWQKKIWSLELKVWPSSPWQFSLSSLWYLLLPAHAKGHPLSKTVFYHQLWNDSLLCCVIWGLHSYSFMSSCRQTVVSMCFVFHLPFGLLQCGLFGYFVLSAVAFNCFISCPLRLINNELKWTLDQPKYKNQARHGLVLWSINFTFLWSCHVLVLHFK